jgi:hypothetical protein
LSSATSDSQDVVAAAARGAMKAFGGLLGGIVGGGTRVSLSKEAGATCAGLDSAMARKSAIMEATWSRMDATNWVDFSRRSRVEDGDGTATRERGSTGAILESTTGDAAAVGGATAMEGAGGRGAGDGTRGINRQGVVGRQGAMSKVRG